MVFKTNDRTVSITGLITDGQTGQTRIATDKLDLILVDAISDEMRSDGKFCTGQVLVR